MMPRTTRTRAKPSKMTDAEIIVRVVKKKEASKRYREAQEKEFALMQTNRYGQSVAYWIKQGNAAYAGERARLAWHWGSKAL